MGIPQLWDVIKDEDRVIRTSELAEDFFSEHGRPLRIAVDEADWVHNNVTREQVANIRKKSGKPYRGIEKNIFYRICDLLTLNVHLLFVFDSPQRPLKRARRHGTKLNPKDTECLKQVLDAFRIPYHQAKGEAEAECVRLQQLSIVDAVWSQDSDCLLFGCDFLIHDNRVANDRSNTNRAKGNTKKDSSTLKVVRGPEIREKYGLTRDGLLLFAMLCGGDFNPQGLRNCGPKLAVRAVNDGVGQGLSMCRTQDDCVDLKFPDIHVLNKYNKPTVFSDSQLEELRGLCEQSINEPSLFSITGPFFNIWGKGYLEWISPILLTRWLLGNTALQANVHQIQLVKQRAVKGDALQPSTLKVRFSPFGITTLGKRQLVREWTQTPSHFDPDFFVEDQIPTCLLKRVLPSLSERPPPKTGSRKRAMQEEENVTEHKRKRTGPYNNRSLTRSPTKNAEAGTISPNCDYINLISDSGEEAEELSTKTSMERYDHAKDSTVLLGQPTLSVKKGTGLNSAGMNSAEMIRAARLRVFDPQEKIETREASRTDDGRDFIDLTI